MDAYISTNWINPFVCCRCLFLSLYFFKFYENHSFFPGGYCRSLPDAGSYVSDLGLLFLTQMSVLWDTKIGQVIEMLHGDFKQLVMYTIIKSRKTRARSASHPCSYIYN